jgi:predicted DNA-binding WGR domain protein
MPTIPIRRSMPTPTVTKKTDLAYRAGTSDKVYHVWVENVGANHFVKFKYGRRGSTLTEGTKVGPTDTAAALREYDKIVAEKLGKGYKPMKPMSAAADRPDPRGMKILDEIIRDHGKLFMDPSLGKPGPIGVAGVDVKAGDPVVMSPTGRVVTAKGKGKTDWTLGDKTSCQLLNPIDEGALEAYLSDDKWIFQEKHDGRRMLIGSEEGDAEAWNRKGQLVPPPEEYCSVLQSCFGGFSFVIDGEACGDKFYAFDILWLEGLDCRTLPLHERLVNLGMLIRSGGHQDTIRQVVTAMGKGDKAKMIEILRKRNGEGLCIKDMTCPYTSGRPNSYGPALKFKFVESASCAVIKVNAKRSVELGLYKGESDRKSLSLTSVGNVTIPANHDIPEVGEVVEVQYLYAYKGGSLYQPVYKGPRDDVPVDTFDRLKYKPGEMPASVLVGKTSDLSAEIMEAIKGSSGQVKKPKDAKGFFRLDDGRFLRLLTPAALKKLPYGTPLVDVNGEDFVSGEDELDDDERGGLSGYGIVVPSAADLIDSEFVEETVAEILVDAEGKVVSKFERRVTEAVEALDPTLADRIARVEAMRSELEKAEVEALRLPDPRHPPPATATEPFAERMERELRARAERAPLPPRPHVDWTYDQNDAD